MPTGRAVIIGVGKVDPTKYSVQLPELPASVRDAKCLLDIASKASFDVDTQLLLTEEATQQAVLDAIGAAVQVCKSGDLFLLGYSGHGRQFKDFTGKESDHKSETWCLYDGAILDTVIESAISAFDPGVRILVTSDSCHSGTILSFADKIVVKAKKLVRAAKKMLVATAEALNIMTPAPNPLDSRPIIQLSSSRDDQESSTGNGTNSAFTAALLEVWNDGAFTKSYREFHSAIQLKVTDPAQTPQLAFTKAAETAFVRQRPFTI